MSELILLVGGTTVSAYGQYQQGQALRAQAESEAAIGGYNVQLAEQQAVEVAAAAKEEAAVFGKESERIKATQRARFARGRVTGGSVMNFLTSQSNLLELDRLQILKEGRISARQARAQANIYRMGATAARRRGKAQARGATLAAAGTLLTGYGTAAYLKSKRT